MGAVKTAARRLADAALVTFAVLAGLGAVAGSLLLMAEGFGGPGAGTALDALVAAHPWVGLHTGAPGAAGTSNNATETTRKQATWNATGTDGIVENSNALTWLAIAGSQDATHFTGKSANAAGNFGYSGAVAANPYVAGDTFEIAIGALVVSVPLAS